MQKVWSISGRSIAVSALALALAACQSMRGPEPVVKKPIYHKAMHITALLVRLLLNRVINNSLLTRVCLK